MVVFLGVHVLFCKTKPYKKIRQFLIFRKFFHGIACKVI
jgi:hypothetical protein